MGEAFLQMGILATELGNSHLAHSYFEQCYQLAKKAVETEPTNDRWNYWVFRTSLNGYTNGEKTYKSYQTWGSFNADRITERLTTKTPAIISVFAGRIADTGRDPMPIMAKAVQILKAKPRAELIWASPRELLNVFQADSIGCHIITATNDILKKLSLVGKDLERYSLETVEMFYKDAQAAGYTIAARKAA